MSERIVLIEHIVRVRGRAIEKIEAVVELARIGWTHRRQDWWRTPPFLPLPSAAHLGWRRFTAYGDTETELDAGDVLDYAIWRRRQRRART